MNERPVGTGHNQPPVSCVIPGQPWPQDAQALIFRRAQPVTTSGRAGTGQWILRFERRLPQTIEPLMGWTADDDTLTQVELRFSSKEEAIAYAEREGLAYRVEGEPLAATRSERERRRKEAQRREAEDLYMTAAALAWMDAQYGVASVGRRPDLDRALVDPASVFAAPSEVVHDPSLSIDDKREILRRWAWDEWLLEVEANESPASSQPSRYDEVKSALMTLDQLERTQVLLSLNTPPQGRSAA
ncbi:NADH dehydrogenase ubiquinone Fe-S protein 4 [Microvirga pakistanensis]|uniref:NADH dehydrogenase ubiquinone Fe-S protein 4 n=1 Tax=Microvirga pakistanensis TaxID=1682650 RepID=UPI00141B9962|nr:NADH dehydrogenase ubiquinone Fe-S protein 4 [Microvirga pakistanensis]